jgi:hypothetical protein
MVGDTTSTRITHHGNRREGAANGFRTSYPALGAKADAPPTRRRVDRLQLPVRAATQRARLRFTNPDDSSARSCGAHLEPGALRSRRAVPIVMLMT